MRSAASHTNELLNNAAYFWNQTRALRLNAPQPLLRTDSSLNNIVHHSLRVIRELPIELHTQPAILQVPGTDGTTVTDQPSGRSIYFP
ncbi:hypothetical protein D3C79_1030920 [compost metagenome]